MTRLEIMAAIQKEREHQAAKWGGLHYWGVGDCSSHEVDEPVKLAVLSEECGEVARAMLDRKPDQLAKELIQVAAVCVAWLESL